MSGNATSLSLQLSRHETYSKGVPHELFSELRRTQPVFWHERPDGPGFWAVLKYRDIVAVSNDTATFSSANGVFVEDIATGEGIPGSLLTRDPPDHTHLRSRFNKWFAAAAIGGLEPWLRDQARQIMTRAAAQGACEFVYDMAAQLPLLTICQFLGVPEADRPRILELGDAVIRCQDGASFADAMQRIGEYGLCLSRSPAGLAASQLLSEMRQMVGQDDRELAGQFAQLLVAGNETTRTLLSNIILALCDLPETFAELKDHPERIPLAIEEFLRWSSPVYYMRRTARVDCTLGGHNIKAGAAVVMYYVSANRDEEIFSDPDIIDTHRRPNPHLAFGVGRHNCLGARLARFETRIFLEEFFARFRGVALAGKPQRFPSNVVNAWEAIPIRLHAA